MTLFSWLKTLIDGTRDRGTVLLQQGTVRWRGFSARERAVLGFGTLFVLFVVVWAVCVRPAVQAVTVAQRSIPQLRVELAQIQALVAESRSLSRQTAGVIAPQDMQSAIESSLESQGLASSVQVLEAPKSDGAVQQWRVVFTSVNAAEVFTWLSDLSYTLRVQITTVDLGRAVVSGRSQPDRLSGEVILKLHGEGAA